MQLSFIPKLYEKDVKGTNFLKNIDSLIKNFKFLRSKIEDKIGYMDQNSDKFKEYAYASDKIGYCMYWLATVGFIHELDINKEKKVVSKEWYDKTISKPVYGASVIFSISDIYEHTNRQNSLLNQFILRHSDRLDGGRLSRLTIRNLKESKKDLMTEIKKL